MSLSEPTHSRAADADLLRRYVRDRDDLAFGRLMARHARAVRRVAYGYVHDRHAAEDVSQAAFLVLAKRPKAAMRSTRRRGSCLPWLAKVARYASANWYRADRLRRRHERDAARPETGYDPTRATDLADAVRLALRRLSRRERRIVEWRHVEQLSWDDVARRAGTSPDAARKAGARALANLRGVLERRGITATGAAVLAGLKALTATTSSTAAQVTAAELAAGVITMLKLKTAAITTAAVLATVGVVAASAALVQNEPAIAATKLASPESATTSGRFSDGTTVRLVRLTDRDGTTWWSPHGEGQASPADERYVRYLEGQARDRALDRRLRGDEAASGIEWPIGLHALLEFDVPDGHLGRVQYQTRGSAGGGIHGLPVDGMATHLVSIDAEDDEPARLDVTVAVGDPVDSIEVLAGTRSGLQSAKVSGLALTFSPTGRWNPTRDETFTTFVTVFVGGDSTAVQLDATLILSDGTEVIGTNWYDSGRRGTRSLTYDFGDVPVEQVEMLRVDCRALEMMRFTDLPTRLEAERSVRVEHFDHPAYAELVEAPVCEAAPSAN